MEQITKKQHFIPEFYLKNFCADDGKLAVYNCKYNDFGDRKTPAQICYEKYLYETKVDPDSDAENFVLVNEVENNFRDKETIYRDCISRILDTCSSTEDKRKDICSDDDIKILNDFVANMLLRNPMLYNKVDDSDLIQETLNSEDYVESIEFLTELTGYEPEVILRFILNLDSTDSDLKDSMANLLKKQISKFGFTFFVSDNKRFVFGEFPFAIHMNKSNRFDKILIPLSPTCLLMYHRHPTCNKMILSNDYDVTISNKLLSNISVSKGKRLFAQNEEDIENVLKFRGEIND